MLAKDKATWPEQPGEEPRRPDPDPTSAPGLPATLRGAGAAGLGLGDQHPTLEPPGGSPLEVPCARLRQLAQDNRDGVTALLSCSEPRGTYVAAQGFGC